MINKLSSSNGFLLGMMVGTILFAITGKAWLIALCASLGLVYASIINEKPN
ncbi:hypothetical protein GF326_13525 [Candidatus Bathyarchaeota archaeon]|nr:hypothetical protein [Candidatus Bathyarchaeota archaeon]